jgi:YhcH/YjgK/YiaL family protein
MILDNLSQCDRYKALSPRFAKAFEFLKKFDGTARNGRYDLDGDNAYALVQRYTTKPQSEGVFEAHRKYIDVQFVFKGRETIFWAPLESLTPHTKEAYKDEGDYALFHQVPTATPMRLSDGQFTILYPEDGHIPCSQWDGPCEVVKVVVKVRV